MDIVNERYDILSNMKKKELIPIGRKLGIKYLTSMLKEEIVDEILQLEFSIDMCEHKEPKYKCKMCGGLYVCEHSNHKMSCRTCHEERERYNFYVKSIINDYCPFVEAMMCVSQ